MVLKTNLNCVIHLLWEYQHRIDLWFWNFFFSLPCRPRNFLWETLDFPVTPTFPHKVSLSPSNPPPLSLFLQYSCWNINGHIFVCCWDIWYIPHTSWYSVLLSQSTWSTISSHQFSKLTIFISVFRIFSQPVFLFLLYQSLNDQYQQPCTNNFSLIFLTDEQTDKQTNKHLL